MIQGDMSRTLVTPANSLRVLSSLLTQLKRALGNIVSVIVTQFIPYVQALVSVVTDAANALAKLLGFELPKIDYASLGNNGLGGVLEDAEESAGGVSDAVKKIKKQLMGFDELNIIGSPNKDSGSGGGGAAGVGGDLGMDLYEYDFLKGLDTSKLDEIKEKMSNVLSISMAISGALMGIKFGKFLGSLLTGAGLAISSGGLMAAFGGGGIFMVGLLDALINGIDWISGILIPLGTTISGAGIGAIIGSLGGPIGTGLGALIGLAVGLFVDGLILIKENWGTIKEFFKTNVIDPLSSFFTTMWGNISRWASECWYSIKMFFTPAVNWFSQLFGNIGRTANDIFYNIGVLASGSWEIVKKAWSLASNWFNTSVVKPIANFFSPMWNGLKKGASDAWAGIKSVFSTVATFFKNIFSDAWNGVVKVFSSGGAIFTDIKNGILAGFKSVVNGLIRGINSVVSVPFNGINSALSFIRNIKFLGITPFTNLGYISVPSIPLLASGGMVDTGQMFIAREAGPELVGQIGNKTAVANNNQIVSGIEAGVFRAMTAANGNGGKPINITVISEIDGEVAGKNFVKYHNGVVTQTGESPLMV